MGEDGKSNLGATATIIVAVVGLLTAIVNIVPKLLDNAPKVKTEQQADVNGGGTQQFNQTTSPQTGNGGQQGGGIMPTTTTDAEKEALKQKQAQLELQMEQMKKDLEAQKKRGNATVSGNTKKSNDDVYYSPPKVTGTWNVSGYPGMQYIFNQSGSNIAFTMMYGGMNTGSGQGYLDGTIVEFEAMDSQSTYTGSLEISPDGRSMSGVAYNAYGTYIPINLVR